MTKIKDICDDTTNMAIYRESTIIHFFFTEKVIIRQ
jgi:hypothetical protein